MDEIALNKAATDGKHASMLMEDQMLQSAFRQLEQDYATAWRNSAAMETELREKLWLAIQIVGKVRHHLVRIASGGKLAQKDLEEFERRKRFKII